MVSLQDVQFNNVTSGSLFPRVEVTISVGKYPEKLQNSYFERHFLEKDWSYRHEIVNDNLENQVRLHIKTVLILLAH